MSASTETTSFSVSGETLQFGTNETNILAYWKQINAFETSNKLSKDRPKYGRMFDDQRNILSVEDIPSMMDHRLQLVYHIMVIFWQEQSKIPLLDGLIKRDTMSNVDSVGVK